MWMSLRARSALLALLGATLLAAAGAPAWAGEEEISEEVVTETRQMKVFVTTENGEQKVKVLRLQDGEWVPVEGEGAATPPVRVRIGAAAEKPLALAFGSAAPAAKKAADTPLPTILRWLFEDAAQEKDPLDAWFAAGNDVPFAHLRNALKRDGWTPDRLRTWMYEMVETHLESFLTNHAQHGMGHGYHAGHGRARAPAARGCGCAHCRPPAQHPPCPSCGHHGARHGAHHGHGMPHRAYVVYYDGAGWQHHPIPTPHGAHGGHGAHRMPSPPAGHPAPQAAEILRHLLGQGAAGADANHGGKYAELFREITPHLPQLLGAFEDLDPATRQALMKQLADMGAELLDAPAEKEAAK